VYPLRSARFSEAAWARRAWEKGQLSQSPFSGATGWVGHEAEERHFTLNVGCQAPLCQHAGFCPVLWQTLIH